MVLELLDSERNICNDVYNPQKKSFHDNVFQVKTT
jgi:hypothetical protein